MEKIIWTVIAAIVFTAAFYLGTVLFSLLFDVSNAPLNF